MWMWVWVWRGFAPHRTPAPRADFTLYRAPPRRVSPPYPTPTAQPMTANRLCLLDVACGETRELEAPGLGPACQAPHEGMGCPKCERDAG